MMELTRGTLSSFVREPISDSISNSSLKSGLNENIRPTELSVASDSSALLISETVKQPENRTIDTDSLIGREAASGLGWLISSLVSTPKVSVSATSTSILPSRRPSVFLMRQLLKIGKSFPMLISVMTILSKKSGIRLELKISFRDWCILLLLRASFLNCEISCATRTLNQSNDSG
ncbi:hypothetical protein OGAPHI_005452 [Ogataea philodendri]|uniref:Uncharacterized protein n=1 Tax=Ogataea philodendri TaxID=1378263 RepID=A0A9P8P033_9ASCO|nr:uncharacterized protein OGAPHI_005452 [Ogataea philodendri]KAH3662204.1 hypothetical protein OGAPHI_005452 [Ogataea philodendri]